jgi:hypothetical protein
MKVRLRKGQELVTNCETPKAYAVKMWALVFVPKSKCILTPVESSKYYFIDKANIDYKEYDLVVSNAFLEGKDELIEELNRIYHFNKMHRDNVTDIPYNYGN